MLIINLKLLLDQFLMHKSSSDCTPKPCQHCKRLIILQRQIGSLNVGKQLHVVTGRNSHMKRQASPSNRVLPKPAGEGMVLPHLLKKSHPIPALLPGFPLTPKRFTRLPHVQNIQKCFGVIAVSNELHPDF